MLLKNLLRFETLIKIVPVLLNNSLCIYWTYAFIIPPLFSVVDSSILTLSSAFVVLLYIISPS